MSSAATFESFLSMPIRRVICFICGLACAPEAPTASAAEAVIVVQRSPLAGLRHHEAGVVWRELRPGDPLELVREPG